MNNFFMFCKTGIILENKYILGYYIYPHKYPILGRNDEKKDLGF